MSYRHPNVLPECALDIMAGVAYLKHCRYQPVMLVGHSFGGAVVIAAGALNDHVAGVVALSPQTYGAHLVGQLAPRPLLVVHGTADTRLPYSCGVQIYTGLMSRNSWYCTREPSTAWKNAPKHWNSF